MNPCSELCLCYHCFDNQTFNSEYGTCENCNNCVGTGYNAGYTTSCDIFDDEDDH